MQLSCAHANAHSPLPSSPPKPSTPSVAILTHIPTRSPQSVLPTIPHSLSEPTSGGLAGGQGISPGGESGEPSESPGARDTSRRDAATGKQSSIEGSPSEIAPAADTVDSAAQQMALSDGQAAGFNSNWQSGQSNASGSAVASGGLPALRAATGTLAESPESNNVGQGESLELARPAEYQSRSSASAPSKSTRREELLMALVAELKRLSELQNEAGSSAEASEESIEQRAQSASNHRAHSDAQQAEITVTAADSFIEEQAGPPASPSVSEASPQSESFAGLTETSSQPPPVETDTTGAIAQRRDELSAALKTAFQKLSNNTSHLWEGGSKQKPDPPQNQLPGPLDSSPRPLVSQAQGLPPPKILSPSPPPWVPSNSADSAAQAMPLQTPKTSPIQQDWSSEQRGPALPVLSRQSFQPSSSEAPPLAAAQNARTDVTSPSSPEPLPTLPRTAVGSERGVSRTQDPRLVLTQQEHPQVCLLLP